MTDHDVFAIGDQVYWWYWGKAEQGTVLDVRPTMLRVLNREGKVRWLHRSSVHHPNQDDE